MIFAHFAAVWVASSQVVKIEASATLRDFDSPLPLCKGFGKSLPKGQAVGTVSNVTIWSSAVQRSYLVSIPSTYNPEVPAPIIFSYHGGDRTAEDQLQLDHLTDPEYNNASLVVYPQGTNNAWQGVPGITTNDVQFTQDILNDVESRYCINPSRITATGKSDGGGFTNVLACDSVLSKRFAAFAPVSGAYYINTLPCTPWTVKIPCSAAKRDIPIIAFHGGNDITIPYDGGKRKHECLPAIPHFIQEWAFRDGLGKKNVSTQIANCTTSYSFGFERKAGLVQLIYESNIGHDWPSTAPNADNTLVGHHVANYNATPMILEFFQTHPLNISPEEVSEGNERENKFREHLILQEGVYEIHRVVTQAGRFFLNSLTLFPKINFWFKEIN